VGLGAGVMVESHTNEVAAGKAITAETCLRDIAHESTINKELLDCMHTGVPGGEKVDPSYLKVGQPIGFIDAYISAQKNEAAHMELGRLAAWSIAPFLVAGYAAFMGY